MDPQKSIGIIYLNNVKKRNHLFKYFLNTVSHFYQYFKFTLKEFF